MVKVVYYLGDQTGAKLEATYVNRQVAERAIERAASTFGWLGIIL